MPEKRKWTEKNRNSSFDDQIFNVIEDNSKTLSHSGTGVYEKKVNFEKTSLDSRVLQL